MHVGDLVLLEKNQWAPVDLTLLRTSDLSGTCFIRTDQLDGETDWKLRVALPTTQKLPFGHEHLNIDAEIYGMSLKSPLCLFVLLPLLQRMRPARTSIYLLARLRLTRHPLCPRTRCLQPMVQVPTIELFSAEDVLWANAVLAVGSAIGFVVYNILGQRRTR
jgi:phospholipid-translocating ATPase